MVLDDCAHGSTNALGLVAIKACRSNRVLQLGLRRVRIIFCRPVFLEQCRRDHIDALVRALRREDRGHEQLERIKKIQLGVRAGINLRPDFNQLFYPLARSHMVGAINILCVVILNEVKDLTIDDRSRN